MTTILTDNQHYTDIASAIRSKAGVQDLFKPSEMAGAIMAIPTGGGASLGSKSITANGTYYASADSLDGYSQVTVNVSGGGGGADFDALVARTISEVVNSTAPAIGYGAFQGCSQLTLANMNAVVSIGAYAFYSCDSLKTASFASCTSIGTSAFAYCANIESLSFPACTYIGVSAFAFCSGSLTTVEFPECTLIGDTAFLGCFNLQTAIFPACKTVRVQAFSTCKNLTYISLPSCENISSNAFRSCFKLISLYLTGVSSVPTLSSYAFTSTPIGGYSASAGQYGSVFVPSSLYADFLTAANWSSISDRIVSV